ncbi:uncharacterized protein LOC123879212 isoform X1 [Maniola jurtina]|uniref:uncharacterized protein LOC123879212 isoform X1 n=1 Tax=Maniola jurtina TaxID=191418 RepID=UPI001E68987C|nr:uncharacterized protein LOC123879212 isoform X1 [Maniola jurtina]
MPLIIICGTPVSGKTTRAIELKQFFENEHEKHVEIVSEDEAIVKLGYDKNSTYLDSQKEKRIRGYLKSEVIRLIGKDNVVILDGSNYIKGYRYELYCASKASKSTQCTVYTIRNQLEAWEENVLRLDVKENNPNEPCDLNNQPYTEEVFNALTKFRFEEPNSNNRWDSPLFTVQPAHQIDLHAIYKVLFEKKPPPPNMSTQNGKGRPLSKIETKCLLRLIESSNIIARKSTDAATNQMKLEEWKKIAEDFNTKTVWRRSPQQLRLKWENLKKCSRKRSLRIKMNHQMGPDEEYIPPDDILDRVAKLLDRPFGGDAELDGLPNPSMSASLPDVDEFITGNIRLQMDEPVMEFVDVEIREQSKEPTCSCHESLCGKRKCKDDWSAARNQALAEYYTTKKKYLDAKMDHIVLQNKKLKLEVEILKKGIVNPI